MGKLKSLTALVTTASVTLFLAQPLQAGTAVVQAHRLLLGQGQVNTNPVQNVRWAGGGWRGGGLAWRPGWGHAGWRGGGWGWRGGGGWGWRGGWAHRGWGWRRGWGWAGGPWLYGGWPAYYGYGYGSPCGYGYYGYGYGCPYYGYGYGAPFVSVGIRGFGFGW